MSKKVSAEAMSLGLLKDIQEAAERTQNFIAILADTMANVEKDIDAMRKNQKLNNVHLKYDIDLSVEHVDFVVADFTKMKLHIDTLTVLKLPSDMSMKLTGLSSESIDLEADDIITITRQEITRLLISNPPAGIGIAHIHVFGRHL